MTTTHDVKQGECLASIAELYGLPWKVIWDDPGNAALRQRRKNPNVLAPGDQIEIPDRAVKKLSASTGGAHSFVLDREESLVRLRLVRGEKPVSGVKWTLEVHGQELSGTTGADGLLETALPPGARYATLRLEKRPGEYRIDLGGLDPADEVSGIQGRLYNLGFYRGKVDGVLSSATALALREFQELYGLAVTGKPDAATTHALGKAHGC